MNEKENEHLASEAWKKKEYQKALEYLNKLQKQMDGKSISNFEEIKDPKSLSIAHNLALVNFEVQGETDPKKLIEELSRLKKYVEDKIAEQSQINNEGASWLLEESETYLLSYNIAVIHFQMKQYANSLTILEQLFQNIESIDEYLAMKICFLLIEHYLILEMKEYISPILGYLEKSFRVFLKEDANNQANNKETSSTSTNNNNAPVNNMEEDETGENGGATTKEDLELERTEKETQPKNRMTPEKNASNLSVQPFVLGSEFRYLLHLYKAKYSLLNLDVKTSSSELKLVLPKDEPTTSVILLQANLAYLQGNYTQAIYLLNSLQKSNDKYLSSIYYNNLGCIHLKLKKFSAAAYYFSKALKENDQNFESKDQPLHVYAKSNKFEILYNFGNQQLISGNPLLAFKCFQETLAFYYKQPKLWLRICECCVAFYAKQLNEIIPQTKNLSQTISGPTDTKKYLINIKQTSTSPLSIIYDEASENVQVQLSESNEDTPTLEYGARCAQNVIILLSRPGSQTLSEEELLMKQSALLNLAFIYLSLKNPVSSLSSSRELLSIDQISMNNKLLGSFYIAEALCWLNRPQEAADYLFPLNFGIGDSQQILPSLASSPYSLKSDPSTNTEFILLINCAVVNILRENIDQAKEFVDKALLISRSTSSILLRVYLDLRKGDVNSALNFLKFPTRDSTT